MRLRGHDRAFRMTKHSAHESGCAGQGANQKRSRAPLCWTCGAIVGMLGSRTTSTGTAQECHTGHQDDTGILTS